MTRPWQLFEFVDPWEVWGESLRVELAGADQSGITSVLHDVCDYFLKTTAVLRAEMFHTIQAGRTDYSINEAFGHDHLLALTVHSVCLNGRWQPPCVPPNLEFLRTPVAVPTFAYVVHPQILRLCGIPNTDVDLGLGVLLSYKLERPISCVPLYLAEHHYEAIQEGVLAKMKAHTKRQYSDREMSMMHRRTYMHEIAEARDQARRRWGNAESPAPYNPAWSYNADSRAFVR